MPTPDVLRSPIPSVLTPAQPINGDFSGKHFIDINQITRRDELFQIFDLAVEMESNVTGRVVDDRMRGYGIAIIFYEPSTRTFESFLAAAQRLGFSYFTSERNMQAFSSVYKGESLEDTIAAFHAGTGHDVFVLRHPGDDSAVRAAAVSPVPLISGGSGTEQHPTQALLDAHAIYKTLGRIDSLNITMIGDPRNGRTIKSLARLLAVAGKNIRIDFVSPDFLRMPPDIIASLQEKGCEVGQHDVPDLRKVLPDTNVLYVTRIQKERFERLAAEELAAELSASDEPISDEEKLARIKSLAQQRFSEATRDYRITPEVLQVARQDMIIMHPLPRDKHVNEIDPAVDSDPRAIYLTTQMRSGLYTRMALLAKILAR